MIRVRIFLNQFSRATCRDERDCPYEAKNLLELTPSEAQTAFLSDGRAVTRDNFSKVIPPDGSTVTFVLSPGVPGVPLFLPGFLGSLGNVFGSPLRTNLFNAIESQPILGKFEINPLQRLQLGFKKLTGLLAPGVPDFNPSAFSSGQYGSTGPQNTAADGTTIPIPFGEVTVGGHIVQAFRVADNATNRQIYQFVIAVADGQIEQFGLGSTVINADADNLQLTAVPEDILVNDIKAFELQDSYFSFRMGSLAQPALVDSPLSLIPYRFPAIEYGQSFRFSKDLNFNYETRDKVNEIHINLAFPSGLTSLNKKTGKAQPFAVTLQVTITPVGGGSPVFDDEVKITKARREILFQTLSFKGLGNSSGGPEKYTVEVFRVKPEVDQADNDGRRFYECNLTGIVEVVYQPHAYRGLALIAATIRASDQLEGGAIPTILTPIKGLNQIETGPSGARGYTRNPAWIARHIFLNNRYGLGNYFAPADATIADWQDFADHCDALVPLFTGSSSTEAAHVFDGVLDSERPALDNILAVMGPARGRPVLSSRKVTVQVDETRSPVFTFSEANIVNNTSIVSGASRVGLPSIVEVQFQNQETREVDAVSDRQFEANDGEQVTVSLLGVRRRTEALRHAAFLARKAQLPFLAHTARVGPETIALVPGDVYRLFSDEMVDSVSGRIVSAVTSTSITLDRSVTLTSGVGYRYYEWDEDGAEDSFDFVGAGTTSATLGFGPLWATAPEGRPWAIVRLARKERLFEITQVTGLRNSEREISGVEYVPEVYSYETGSETGGDFDGGASAAPGDASNVAIVETYFDEGISTLAVTWTGGTGAITHDVYFAFENNGSFTFVGNYSTAAATFQVTAPWGILVRIAIVGVSADGARLTPQTVGASARGSITINRDDENECIALYPGAVTNISLTNISNNEFSLAWTAGANADGYVVARGEWQGRYAQSETTGTSVASVLTNAVIQALIVRAYRNVAGISGTVRYYSESNTLIPTTTGVPATYNATTQIDYPGPTVNAGWRNGQFQNAIIVQDSAGFFGESLEQVDPLQNIEFLSPVLDCGAGGSKFLSLDPQLTVAWKAEIDGDFYFSTQHFGSDGQINKQYIDWTLIVQSNNTGTFADPSTYSQLDVTNLLAGNIFVTARYFRLALTARFRTDAPGDPEDRRIRFETIQFKANPTP